MNAFFEGSHNLSLQESNSKSLAKQLQLYLYADSLNSSLAPSEKWFWELWPAHFDDACNQPFGNFIYDVLNETFKYIIEIDGKSHNTIKQKHIDRKKDKFARKSGFNIFRIRAYDSKSYFKIAHLVFELRAGRKIPNQIKPIEKPKSEVIPELQCRQRVVVENKPSLVVRRNGEIVSVTNKNGARISLNNKAATSVLEGNQEAKGVEVSTQEQRWLQGRS